MSFSNEQLYKRISKSFAHHEQDLADICKKRHAYGIETPPEIESGKGGKVIVFNAEYDALHSLGHACGHNLIATSSIAAFIATAETIREGKLSGTVRLLGTPAEQGGGGKSA
ncbi:hypothetical protein NW760_015229 [Fusarium oxysporum]|nr:ATP-dependent DNA helicase pfh1 [Fusarium oxysporum f. sp. albedinis]KAJ4076260.1 hypothetical protein NW769_015361 [Fusarium oxysporum]KAJ4212916.1 hypothetical protein NW760_015229 [Fusarium oxysporum]KAK2469261.1 hypothetical protein H9L39_18978 [Fusarium oxysporum f. sp. albedinis]